MQQEQQEQLINSVRLDRSSSETLVPEVDDFKQPLEKMLELSDLSQNFKRNVKTR